MAAHAASRLQLCYMLPFLSGDDPDRRFLEDHGHRRLHLVKDLATSLPVQGLMHGLQLISSHWAGADPIMSRNLFLDAQAAKQD